jgi:2-methylaconitate cis-trans-isomerase PrpF
VDEGEIDLIARLIGIDRKLHKTFPGTGAVCLAVAARLPGTVIHGLVEEPPGGESLLRIGHPSGVMRVETRMSPRGRPERAAYATTWRKIMEGHAFLRDDEHGREEDVRGEAHRGARA